MVRTIDATFDGIVFRPAEPISLEPNTRVRITVETATPSTAPTASFLDTASSLNLEGPADWSANLHRYLYEEDADCAG
jgi:hypothetical protein